MMQGNLSIPKSRQHSCFQFCQSEFCRLPVCEISDISREFIQKLKFYQFIVFYVASVL